jgi:hypothetical protein
MKKIIILTIIVLGLCNSINAQVQPVEWEIISAGTVLPTKDAQTLGIIFATEVRFNLDNGKISSGMELSVGGYPRKYTAIDEITGYSRDYRDVGTGFLSFQGLCDYNFNPRRKIMPFAGVGLGLVASRYDDNADGLAFVPSVRIGCEFYKFFRTTLDYRIMKYGFNYFSLRLGFVIGGRNKKIKT